MSDNLSVLVLMTSWHKEHFTYRINLRSSTARANETHLNLSLLSSDDGDDDDEARPRVSIYVLIQKTMATIGHLYFPLDIKRANIFKNRNDPTRILLDWISLLMSGRKIHKSKPFRKISNFFKFTCEFTDCLMFSRLFSIGIISKLLYKPCATCVKPKENPKLK